MKLDGTDIKVALQESMRGEWNGDVDLGNGQLQALRQEYDARQQDLQQDDLAAALEHLRQDVKFLSSGLQDAATTYSKKFAKPGTPNDTLMNLSWNVVEFQTLLQQANDFLRSVTSLDEEAETQRNLVELKVDFKSYLRNLFKKKRTAATHVLVVMIADERRQVKPYAMPLQAFPYTSLQDQFVRELLQSAKEKLTAAGLTVVGE